MFEANQIQSFNELEMEVYRYVVEHMNTIPYMRIRELAKETHVSTTTILRFCKKVDCDGFSEFKFKLKENIGQKESLVLIDDKAEIDRFFTERFPSELFQQQVEEAITIMAKSGTIVFLGLGNSLPIAQYAARVVSNSGKFSVCISDPFYPARMVPNLDATIVILSISGESTQLLELARDVKNTKSTVISITSNPNCSLARFADVAIATGVMPQRREEIDYTTNVPVLYLIEYMAKKLENRKSEE